MLETILDDSISKWTHLKCTYYNFCLNNHEKKDNILTFDLSNATYF